MPHANTSPELLLPTTAAQGESWALEQVNEAILHPAWDYMAAAEGYDNIPQGDSKARIGAIYAISDENWNLRGKLKAANGGVQVERQEVTMDDLTQVYDDPDSERGAAIRKGSAEFRMIDSVPMPSGPLHATFVLGGAARSCWQRTKLAMGFDITPPPTPGETNPIVKWDPQFTYGTPDQFGNQQWGDIVTIGCMKSLPDAARSQFKGIMPEAVRDKDGAWTEADLLFASVRYLLSTMGGRLREHGPIPIQDPGYEAMGKQGNLRVITGGKRTAFCYEAPNPVSEDGRTRANTDNGFVTVRDNNPSLFVPGHEYAIATNSIYGPFQRASFLNYTTRMTGAIPVMATFSAERGGVVRENSQLVAEVHSFARKLYEFVYPDRVIQ